MIPTRELVLSLGSRANAPAARPASAGRAPAARGDLGGYLLQLQRSHGNHYVQRLVDSAPGRSAGLPAGIRAALERRSGMDLSDVRVHYNSPRPAELGALGYTRGSEIHIGPGQEKHIAHEAWHVVQQRQGRVRVTRSESGLPLNHDASLEREADAPAQASLAAPAVPAVLDRPGVGAPIQLKAEDVDRWLMKYRAKTEWVAEADWRKLLVVFAAWESLQKQADEFGGQTGAGSFRRQAVKTIKKSVIEALNSDGDISSAVRRRLVKAWNEGKAKKNQVAFKAPPALDVAFEEYGDVPLWTPLSPLAERYQGAFNPLEIDEMSVESGSPPEKEKKKRKETGSGSEGSKKSKKKQNRKTKTVRTGKGASMQESEVPVVESAPEAALMIRSFQKQQAEIPGGFKIIWGPGMFHRGAYMDIVYSPLVPSGLGAFSREGSIESWQAILKQVPAKYWQQPASFLRVVQAGLRGRAPSDPEIALVCGAMICDVKHGITVWIQLLSELYPMLPPTTEPDLTPGDVQKLFLTWYEYHEHGKRNLSRRKTRPSYRDETRRVKTKEWEMPTIIPSAGSLRIPEGEAPKDPVAISVQAMLNVADPEMLWRFALTNRHFYNYLAKKLRQSRALELT